MPTDLWQFAVTLYQRPGIEQACLQLQSQGVDVCVLMCAAWLGKNRARYQPERLAALQSLTRSWHEQVVLPLRQLRKGWRTLAQQEPALVQLREQVKQLELDAEREQLQRLETLSQNWLSEPATTPQDWLGQLAESLNPAAVQLLRNTAAGLGA
jgi:uncharacterized protein (TIGR02444 family)